MMTSCTNKDVRTWSEEDVDKWFNASKWNTELNISLDKSVDKRQFVEQNILNPKSWNIACSFLKKGGFNEMQLGKQELLEDGTFVNIEEYMTKDSSHFEAHRKYIDIQFLAKGKEYIRLSSMDDIRRQINEYVEDKDIEFFDKENFTEHLLDGSNYMVLFPSDAHMPCMKVDSNEYVRKVVIKIPYVVYEK